MTWGRLSLAVLMLAVGCHDEPPKGRMLAEIKGSPLSRRMNVVREATHLAMRNRGVPRPDGLDKLLTLEGPTTVQLGVSEMSIDGWSSSTTDPVIDLSNSPSGSAYDDSCARALTASFEAATGTQWVHFERLVDDWQSVRHLDLSWMAQPDGHDRATTTLRVRAQLFDPPPIVPSRWDPLTTLAVDVPLSATFSPDAADAFIELACTRVGELLVQQLAGRGLAAADHATSDHIVDEDRCAAGNEFSCVKAGDAYRDGVGVAPDPARASQLYARGCELTTNGQAAACEAAGSYALAQANVDALHASRHQDDAHRYLSTACAARSATACARLAELDQGAEAFGHRMEACDLRDVESCALAARALAVGDGVPTCVAAAAILGARACAAGFSEVCEQVPSWKRAARGEREVFGIKLHKRERVVDVRAGAWFENEQTAVVWVSSPESARTLEGRPSSGSARVRVHDLERYDIIGKIQPAADVELPDDVRALYGVAPEPRPGVRFCQCERGGWSKPLACHCREE